MVLHSLWFGISNWNPNVFCKPFVEETIQLFDHRFEKYDNAAKSFWESRTLYPIAIADVPARAMPLNFVQYKGEYGCSYSDNTGITVEKGDGFPNCTPFAKSANHRFNLTTCNCSNNQWKKHNHHVKEFSILLVIQSKSNLFRNAWELVLLRKPNAQMAKVGYTVVCSGVDKRFLTLIYRYLKRYIVYRGKSVNWYRRIIA